MSGKLTKEDMDQLEMWIGTGSKTFTLLYSITRDGCSGPIFHQKCDHMGPTVTVLHNPQGSVYGGYTSVNWNGATSNRKDTNAFMYQLKFSGNKVVKKFPLKVPEKAIYTNPTCGPVFGSDDLHSFCRTVSTSGGTVALNGNMSGFGIVYDTQGVVATNVNNGSMVVTELEVYKVEDGPRTTEMETMGLWRVAPQVNEQHLEKLMEEIENFKPMSDVHISEFRILMIGPVGSGKSSFFNTIDSVFRGRISRRAICGSAMHSTTTAYTPHEVITKKGSTLGFVLCDTRGLEETRGIDTMECTFLVDGHVPDFFEFNPDIPITLQTNGFLQEASPGGLAQCVVFVIDASTVNDIPAKLVDKMNACKKIMNQRKIPQAVVLTHVDKISEEVKANAMKVFSSKEVESVVQKVSGMFGIPPNSIFPVKNYHSELRLDDNISCLALMVLQELLYMAEDFTLNLLSKKKRGFKPHQPSFAQDDSEQTVTCSESDTA